MFQLYFLAVFSSGLFLVRALARIVVWV
jgi:hypothetical protein